MSIYLKTAVYFEGRAKRARTVEDRERFLVVARRYRDRAKAEAGSEPRLELAAPATEPDATLANRGCREHVARHFD
jgi:hypothetical protein